MDIKGVYESKIEQKLDLKLKLENDLFLICEFIPPSLTLPR